MRLSEEPVRACWRVDHMQGVFQGNLCVHVSAVVVALREYGVSNCSKPRACKTEQLWNCCDASCICMYAIRETWLVCLLSICLIIHISWFQIKYLERPQVASLGFCLLVRDVFQTYHCKSTITVEGLAPQCVAELVLLRSIILLFVVVSTYNQHDFQSRLRQIRVLRLGYLGFIHNQKVLRGLQHCSLTRNAICSHVMIFMSLISTIYNSIAIHLQCKFFILFKGGLEVLHNTHTIKSVIHKYIVGMHLLNISHPPLFALNKWKLLKSSKLQQCCLWYIHTFRMTFSWKWIHNCTQWHKYNAHII